MSTWPDRSSSQWYYRLWTWISDIASPLLRINLATLSFSLRMTHPSRASPNVNLKGDCKRPVGANDTIFFHKDAAVSDEKFSFQTPVELS